MQRTKQPRKFKVCVKFINLAGAAQALALRGSPLLYADAINLASKVKRFGSGVSRFARKILSPGVGHKILAPSAGRNDLTRGFCKPKSCNEKISMRRNAHAAKIMKFKKSYAERMKF